jgi:hypothetical protein
MTKPSQSGAGALLMTLVSVGLGCGSSPLSGGAHGDGDIAPGIDGAASDGRQANEVQVCTDATFSGDAGAYTPSGPPTCGGQVSVAGLTPFGLFVAENVWTQVNDGDCHRLGIFFEGKGDGSGNAAGISLRITLPYEVPYDPQKSRVGTFHVDGFLSGMGDDQPVSVTLDISAADALFRPDGTHLVAATSDHGTPGHITGRIDAVTGCGHIVGTFSVPYCSELACVGPAP